MYTFICLYIPIHIFIYAYRQSHNSYHLQFLLFSCGGYRLPALKYSHCARHLLSSTLIVISTPTEEKIELILMTFPRRVSPFRGQVNVKNVLGLDVYIHWQTRECGTSLDVKQTHAFSGLVIGMPTYFHSDRLHI